MSTPRVPVHRAFRAQRQRMGLTQAQLARRVGTTQPAISMFESGQLDALSQEKVEAIAAILEVDLAVATREAGEEDSPAGLARLFICPNEQCFGNPPVIIDGEMRYLPSITRARARTLHCPFCSEILLAHCATCGHPVGEGIFCTKCGKPLVGASQGARVDDPEAWADAERARRQQFCVWTRPRDYPPVREGSHAEAEQAGEPSEQA